MTTIPPPPIPPAVPPGYVLARPGRGMAIAAIVVGAVGAVIGLGPFIFGVFAAAAGVAALVLGVIAYRTGKRVGVKQGRAGIVLGVLALGFGIFGMVTVDQAVNDLQEDLEQIGPADTADYVPPTEAEINAASIDDLYVMYGEAPIDSDSEARIEAELTERGEFG